MALGAGFDRDALGPAAGGTAVDENVVDENAVELFEQYDLILNDMLPVLARARGERNKTTRIVAGVRIWY